MNPEDDLFARLLQHNKLITEMRLAKAVAELEALGNDEDAPPPPTLGQFLVDKGVIKEKVKAAIEQVLVERVENAPQPPAAEYAPPGASHVFVASENPGRAEPRPEFLQGDAAREEPEPEPPDLSPDGASADPLPKRSATTEQIRRRHQWKPRSKRMSEAVRASQRMRKAEDTPEAPVDDEVDQPGAAGQDFSRFIRRVLPSRLHQRFLQHCVKTQVSVFGEKDLTRVIGIQSKRASEICLQWVQAGLAKKLGEGTYNFAPGGKLRQEMDAFLEAWRNPEQRHKLMQQIMAHETQ